jgi:hypothetical protein
MSKNEPWLLVFMAPGAQISKSRYLTPPVLEGPISLTYTSYLYYNLSYSISMKYPSSFCQVLEVCSMLTISITIGIICY